MKLRGPWWFLIPAILTAVTVIQSSQGQTDDPLRAQLQASGLSPRSYDLMMEKVQSTHYAKDYVAIADYTLPSSQSRFFLIDLKNKSFKAFPVSHATGSGGLYADTFTNVPFRLKSSLGFMKTGLHTGKFGKSLILTGISPSNTRINLQPDGPILIHGAEYASDEYLKQYGFRGRSYGCFAVPYDHIGEISESLGGDALVLAYHDRLWDEAQRMHVGDDVVDANSASHGPTPKATSWEVEENLNGQNHGRIGFYQQKFSDIRAGYGEVRAP
jgi:hypothetical protein